MRVFISADIEGTTCTTIWDETEIGTATYPEAAAQMTREVKAACEGAVAAGADYILVNDAHGKGINIDVKELPECVEVIRGWTGRPFGMADGVDESFDAAMFVGYHAAAGRNGNPLSHTESTVTTRVTLNGLPCSEFLLYSYACAMVGVPTVFLAGDKTLTDDSKELHPMLKTVAVKDGFGGAIKCIHPLLACKKIKAGAEEALRQNLAQAGITLPKHYIFEVSYKEHRDAVRRSNYPGFKLTGERTMTMETDDLMDVLRAAQIIL